MVIMMVLTFVAGYILIALEHDIGINKAATAIILGMSLWVMYMFSGDGVIAGFNAEEFGRFIENNKELAASSTAKQCAKFVSNFQVVEYLGEFTQIIFYLIGAMTIVEVIDVHGGFSFVTNKITTANKRKLLWILAFVTFFMSAVLDNLTTAIVMVMLLRKLVATKRERWLYAAVIIIAANSGGAWTPTGDVTTIMLWINENITTLSTMGSLFLPSVASIAVPLLFVSYKLGKGDVEPPAIVAKQMAAAYISSRSRLTILIMGIAAFLCVPVFKAVTGLPPFMGVMIALGVIWVYVDNLYRKNSEIPPQYQHKIHSVMGRIDMATIVFFIGILMAVAALQCAGVLGIVSAFLDKNVHDVYVINTIIGALSSIVDNVPLVAGAMGMYAMPSHEAAAAASEAAYAFNFVQDGIFWQTLAYCAGVGGSILIIGSAAGVVVMGLEKITFVWYMKTISPTMLLGYLSGILVYAAQKSVFELF